ncbi:MAG TPA: ATP-binding protein [Candidatus Eisenbacteria bacterium]
MIRLLPAAELRRAVDPESLPMETTADLPELEGIIGQERAVSALRFGLGIADGGFNVYASGPPGIGRMTAVQSFVRELAKSRLPAADCCYVHHFQDPERPKAIRLAAGQGRRFQRDMQGLIDHLRQEIPKAFESEDYATKRDAVVGSLAERRAAVFESLRAKAEAAGFSIESTPVGIVIVPVKDGKPLDEEAFQALPPEAREAMKRRREALEEELKAAMREVRSISRDAQERLRELNQRVALYLVGGLIDDLSEKYRGTPEVVEHLRAVQADIVERIDTFRAGAAAPEEDAPSGSLPLLLRRQRDLPYRRYEVNVIVDQTGQAGAPVVVETNPTHANLFGRIERESELGAVFTDFTMIRAGSLHRANGGFLVLPVLDVLREPFVWEGLKRALKARQIQIEEIAERLGFLATKSLRPQPVPLDVKVVLVGQPHLYHLLVALDEDFPELFKVAADFDTRMARGEPEVKEFLRFLGGFCRREKICHIDRGGAAKLIEYAARLAGDAERLSTRLGPISDLVREAHYWAREDRSLSIGAAHVTRALDERVYRSGLLRERIREMIERGFILIDVDGESVGQVNGLSVLSLGDISFGKPSRITAAVSAGRDGVVDIEREAKLGGPIHSKGVLILGGYLLQRFAQDRPLTLAARLVFEQSYEGVEGDSASGAECFTLLSALSGAPIRQGVAVTGSMNQRGEIQAIGGVNEKIEGYFDVCVARGLTGRQGVLIPRSNTPHLMLREDVVRAAADGRFHVWTMETVDDGIEHLTGLPAGSRGPDGAYPPESVNGRVEATLRRFAESMRAMGGGEGRAAASGGPAAEGEAAR